MHYEDVKALTLSGEKFVIRSEKPAGERIGRFVKNESDFLSGPRSLIDRLRYFFTGLATYPAPAFGLLWNRAPMDGYELSEIRRIEGWCEFHFSK